MAKYITLGILIFLNIIFSHKTIFSFIVLCKDFIISNIQIVALIVLIGYIISLASIKIAICLKDNLLKIKEFICKYGYISVFSSVFSILIATYALYCKSFVWATTFYIICLICNIKKENLANFIIMLRQLGIKEINTPWLNLKIEEMEQIIAKIKNDKPSAFASISSSKISEKDDDTDLQLSILEISIDIERKIRKIAQFCHIKTRGIGLMRILSSLLNKKQISHDINALVRDFWPIRNEIVHQDFDIYISEESYKRMMELGIQILSLLEFEIELKSKEQFVNS